MEADDLSCPHRKVNIFSNLEGSKSSRNVLGALASQASHSDDRIEVCVPGSSLVVLPCC